MLPFLLFFLETSDFERNEGSHWLVRTNTVSFIQICNAACYKTMLPTWSQPRQWPRQVVFQILFRFLQVYHYLVCTCMCVHVCSSVQFPHILKFVYPPSPVNIPTVPSPRTSQVILWESHPLFSAPSKMELFKMVIVLMGTILSKVTTTEMWAAITKLSMLLSPCSISLKSLP
jgi:hypothetical protein